MNDIKRKIKVLQLHPKYNIKSIDVSDLGEQVLKALSGSEYITVNGFLTGKPKDGEPVSCADRSVYFEFKEKQLKGLRLKVLWEMYKFLKEEKFDVVLCNRYKPVNIMLSLSKFLKIPLCVGIVHGFGDYDRYYRKQQLKRNISSNWRFVGVSTAVKNYLISLNCGLTENNTLAITNAIDIQQAKDLQVTKEEARAFLKLPAEKIIIGALGRLVPVKGHTYLIEAFSKVAMSFPEVDLVIIGEGRERDKLQKLINEYQLNSRVHLTGFVENALEYVKAFDIWVMPSLQEGLGLALLEGMTASLPIIASDVPAMRPLVEGARGTLVEPGNSTALAEALRRMLSLSSAQRLELGEYAFNYVEAEHSLQDFQKQYLALIESVEIKK